MDRRKFIRLGAGAVLVLGANRYSRAAEGDNRADLRIIATTDVHCFLTDFDYYKDAPTNRFGFTRVATLIDQARREVTNSVLVDNGDLIQGNPIADYQVAEGAKQGKPHPAILVNNAMQYDVGTLGNHEFNYGLEYLNRVIKQAHYPTINTNVVRKGTNEPMFQPYAVQEKEILNQAGNRKKIRIGYLGFVPPQIMLWDKANLAGKAEVRDIVQTARKYIPILKKNDVDIIIALAHTGPFDGSYRAGMENAAFHLAGVKGINAVIFGHSHGLFPSKEFEKSPHVDIEKGTVRNVPASMAGYWASHIGIINLTLEKHRGKWTVTDGSSELRPIYDEQAKTPLVNNHPKITELLRPVHEATRRFVAQPIGRSSNNMYSYLALVQDDPTIQIVNRAQTAYTRKIIKNLPKLAKLPILSASAPFKSGGRKNDPLGYTEVNKGQLTFRNASDLYLYPNTLVIVQVSGSELKEWLECSAGMFNQIDITSEKPQSLLNWEGFRTYNYDVIDGIEYQFDITQPPRYDGECNLINSNAHRVVKLTFKGKPVNPKAKFLIATNDYRAYGSKFPGTGDDHIVFASPDENRQILVNYISSESKAKGEVIPTTDKNWRIAPIQSEVKLDIRFETSPTEKAAAFIQTDARHPMTFVGMDEIGFAVYRIDLSR